MRTIRAYQLKCGLKLSAYENKVPNLVIKLEIPNLQINDNMAIICPLNVPEDFLCKTFDAMIEECKECGPNKVKQLFITKFVNI